MPDAGSAGLGPTLTVDELASRAAAAALPVPGPGQWVYRNYAVVAAPGNALSPVIAERWATADHCVAAAYVGGQLEVGPWSWPADPQGEIRRMPIRHPAVPYASLSALPEAPGDLLAQLARTPVDRAPEWHAGHVFELIADLLQHYAMSAPVAARLYQALAAVSGVTAHAGALDAAGQPGTGFLLADSAGGNQEIIVGPRSFQFQGYQFLGQGQDLHAAGAWGMAILRQALVPAPGIRPPGQPEPSHP
jgi:hypothetical protein